jgi:hypothetical protein
MSASPEGTDCIERHRGRSRQSHSRGDARAQVYDTSPRVRSLTPSQQLSRTHHSPTHSPLRSRSPSASSCAEEQDSERVSACTSERGEGGPKGLHHPCVSFDPPALALSCTAANNKPLDPAFSPIAISPQPPTCHTTDPFYPTPLFPLCPCLSCQNLRLALRQTAPSFLLTLTELAPD